MACNTRANQWKALQYETGRIKKSSDYLIRQQDSYFSTRIPMEAGDPEEGLDPREHLEYSFTADGGNYTAIGMAGGTSEDLTLTVNGNCGPTAIETTGNGGESRLCDLPRFTVRAGVNNYGGTYQAVAFQTEEECLDNLTRMHRLQPYINGLKQALPREGKVAHEKSLIQNVIKFSHSNGSVTANGNLLLGNGVIPAEPTHVVDIGYLKQHAQALRGQGWIGPVEYSISEPLLRSMIEAHKASFGGVTFDLMPYKDDISPNFGASYMYEGLLFRILDVPTRGYIKRTGLTSEFVEWEPRKFQAGTAGGVVAEYDHDFNNAYVCCNGASYAMTELIFFAHPTAAVRRPYSRPSTEIDGVVNAAGRFAMDVQLVSGAYLDCNEAGTKFKFLMQHAYQFALRNPRLFGVIATRFKPFTRQLIAPPEPWCYPQGVEVVGPRGIEPPNNACCDQELLADEVWYDPEVARPIAPTADVPRPVNVAGVFVPECVITICADAESVRVSVDRRFGSLGAASLAYTTTPDTAVAGVDYTTTSGTLTWATGEGGVKSTAVIPLLGGAGGVAFSVTFSAPTGAAFAANSCHETCIRIPEPCEVVAESAIDCPAGAGEAT